jgi:E3 ubiquitin-protein ligase makorin
MPVCKYFLAGRCMFGDSCFYQHAVQPSTSNNNSSESPSSSSDNSSTFESTDNSNGLVKRFINKPKLNTGSLTKENSTEKPQEQDEVQHENSKYTPISYYEALTGKKLNIADLSDSDLNMFDENYQDYLRLKASIAASGSEGHAANLIPLCPYFEKNLECPFDEHCEYVHGDLCEYCQMPSLHPTNEALREAHKKECMKRIEREMEEAFAVQCSKEKACGICMEVVWEKETDKRFGILENCNHIFCLDCIRQWRSSKVYENKIVKACPECRVKSDYVTPSKYWFDNEEAKKKIIQEYKNSLGYVTILFLFLELYIDIVKKLKYYRFKNAT